LSARSSQRAAAADLARSIGGSQAQSGIYVNTGGQPGHAAAWDSPRANAQVGGFFRATRRTIEQAFMRPRVAGHRQFQPLAGELIHRFIWLGESSAETCLQAFDRLVDALLWNTAHRAVV